MYIISMVAEKGGVGKSTISALMSQIIGFHKRTLLLDLDQQADSSSFMHLTESPLKKGYTVVDLFSGKCTYDEFLTNGGIRHSGNSNVDVITGSLHLIDLYDRFATVPIDVVRKVVAKNFGVLIQKLSKDYDFIFVDFPPGIDNMWEPILKLSSQIIIPVTPRLMSMTSTAKTVSLLDQKGIKDRITIIPNQVSATTTHQKDLQTIHKIFDNQVYVTDTFVPQASYAEKILEYDQSLFIKWYSNSAVQPLINAFLSLANEMYKIDTDSIKEKIEKERAEYLSLHQFRKRGE